MIRKISETVYECPAFVDTHSHDDLALIGDPRRDDKRLQGVGAQVIGNCGISPFPPLPGDAASMRSLFGAVMGRTDRTFTSLADYRSRFGRDDVRVLQGYNALRAARFGQSPRPLATAERKIAADDVRACIDAGAAGLSLGLAYLPALGSDRDELVEVARQSPLVTVHMRNESSGVLESLNEALEIARAARCRLHVSHLKISGRAYWLMADDLIQKISDAHDELGATFDHYPYAYGCTALSAVLPPEIAALSPADLARVNPRDIERRYEDSNWENYVKMCGWEGLRFASLERYPEYDGKSFAEAATPALPLVLKLVQEEPHPAMLIYSQDDSLIDELLKLPFGCVGTDGLPPVRSHPRLTSSFPEYLRRCKKIGLTPEQAIEKAAMLPRRIFRIPGETGGVTRFDWATGRIIAAPAPPNT